MKLSLTKYLIIAAVLFSVSTGLAEDKFIFESAIGFGSRHMPYSSKWEGAVKSGALDYREFAARGTYSFNSWLLASLTTGWINDILIPRKRYINYAWEVYTGDS